MGTKTISPWAELAAWGFRHSQVCGGKAVFFIQGCGLEIPKILLAGRHLPIFHKPEAGLRQLCGCYWPHGCSHLAFWGFLQFHSRENWMPPLPSPSLYASWPRHKMESAGGVEEPQWSPAWLLRLEREDSSTVLNGWLNSAPLTGLRFAFVSTSGL